MDSKQWTEATRKLREFYNRINRQNVGDATLAAASMTESIFSGEVTISLRYTIPPTNPPAADEQPTTEPV